MGYGLSSLTAGWPPTYIDRMDPDWTGLLQRFRASIPFGTPLKPLAEELGVSYGYLWALVQGIKTNPSADVRAKFARYLAAKTKNVSGVTENVLETAESSGNTLPLTTVAAPVTPVAETPGRRLFEVPTPLHAAIYELLSMLPAAVILRLLPSVEAEVRRQVEPGPPPPPTR